MRQPYQIWRDVYAIGGPDITDPEDCCVYLIDGGELALIDAGAGESFDTLVDNILSLGFNPENLKTVIASHAHIDHLGSLYQLRQRFGARIIAHEQRAPRSAHY